MTYSLTAYSLKAWFQKEKTMPIELTPLPMAEAQAFWADKVQLGPGEFAKLSAEAKVKAFAVSGIARGDELTTVFEAIRRAIDQGTTLADFKKECGAIFERRGWTGKRTWRVDNIGSSPRLRGTRYGNSSWRYIVRFIPAFAGNTQERSP